MSQTFLKNIRNWEELKAVLREEIGKDLELKIRQVRETPKQVEVLLFDYLNEFKAVVNAIEDEIKKRGLKS